MKLHLLSILLPIALGCGVYGIILICQLIGSRFSSVDPTKGKGMYYIIQIERGLIILEEYHERSGKISYAWAKGNCNTNLFWLTNHPDPIVKQFLAMKVLGEYDSEVAQKGQSIGKVSFEAGKPIQPWDFLSY